MVKKRRKSGRATQHTLQHQGHVVVAEGSIAAVMVHKLGGTSQAELLVQAPAAPIDLGVPALLSDQHHCAPCPLADRPLAVWVLTSAVQQLGGLHQVSWGTGGTQALLPSLLISQANPSGLRP